MEKSGSRLRNLAYGALAIRIRGVMVVANALYIVVSVALWWIFADWPEWFGLPGLAFMEVLLAFSSLGPIVALLISRLIPIPFLRKHVKILSYVGIAFVVVLNAWYMSVNIGVLASGGETGDPLAGPDYMSHFAVLLFYPLLALVNIIALMMIRVKQRVSLLRP